MIIRWQTCNLQSEIISLQDPNSQTMNDSNTDIQFLNLPDTLIFPKRVTVSRTGAVTHFQAAVLILNMPNFLPRMLTYNECAAAAIGRMSRRRNQVQTFMFPRQRQTLIHPVQSDTSSAGIALEGVHIQRFVFMQQRNDVLQTRPKQL